jgi:hypothetical protein
VNEMNITYVTVTANDIVSQFGVGKTTASGLIRFLVETGIGSVVSSVARTGRGRAPTTISVPEIVLLTLVSKVPVLKAPARTAAPTITDDSIPF